MNLYEILKHMRSFKNSHMYAVIVTYLLLLFLLFLGRKLTVIWFSYVLVINGVAFAIYWHDKQAAIKKQWRISEKTLLTVSVLGGWIGAWFAQRQFRHKTQKPSFQFAFHITIFTNKCLVLWIALGNGADWILRLL